MPVTIPAGTKFEAIKPTTDVNRRSALVNANDPVFTIEDIAQTVGGGGGFPITNNYIPKASAGSLVDSSLLETTGLGGANLAGNYNNGLYFTYQSSAVLFSASGDSGNINAYAHIGDVFGSSGPEWGINIDGSVAFPYLNIALAGTSVLFFDIISGAYSFGGATTKIGLSFADTPSSAISVSPDLVVKIAGTDYIKVDVGGTAYNIALVP